eukprot:3932872-Rhodomonas_salina.7
MSSSSFRSSHLAHALPLALTLVRSRRVLVVLSRARCRPVLHQHDARWCVGELMFGCRDAEQDAEEISSRDLADSFAQMEEKQRCAPLVLSRI